MSTTTPDTASTPSPRARRALRIGDRAYLGVMLAACVIAVTTIGYFLVKTASGTGEVWEKFGLWGFLTGTEWIPSPANGEPLFGALPFIYGTLTTSIIALVIATPVAIGIALATTVFLPSRLRKPIASVVDLLAAVPSVVYGIWGLLVVVPAALPILEWVADRTDGVPLLGGPVLGGRSFILAGLVLAIMILPIIAAISREVLQTVPTDQREAALAMGATRWEMVRGAMLPWSRSGIVGACALGLGRAVGETVAIAVILGNDPSNLFGSLLQPGSTLASVIALEVPEAGDLQLASLVALAVFMFVLAFAINGVARAIVARSERGPSVRRGRRARLASEERSAAVGKSSAVTLDAVFDRLELPSEVSRSRRIRSRLAEWTIFGFLALSLVPLGMILGTILIRGVPALSWDFFTQTPPADPNDFSGGISHAIVGSLIMMGICAAIAAPLGLLVALFISETVAAPPPVRRFARGIGFFVDVLLGVPSIVVGLIVYLGVVVVQGHFSALAGGLALAVIMFPIVVRSADEILRLVPRTLTEASLALGAPRWRTAWSTVLPTAAPGLITGIMLALARASGEAAPLLFTSLGSQELSVDVNGPMESLPHQILQDILTTVTPATEQRAWGGALVLISIILILTVVARLVGRRSAVSG